MRLSYGWPDGQKNSAFRDRSLPLDSNKPCIMIGRNGSGKTLSSKILSHSRTIFFGELKEMQKSITALTEIGLDWIEVELKIPLIHLWDEEGCVGFREKVALDLIVDDDGNWSISATGDDLVEGWETEFHSFTTNLLIKLKMKNISHHPELSVNILMESKGTLEICKIDESDDILNDDGHKGFSVDIFSETKKLEIEDSTVFDHRLNLWKRTCVKSLELYSIENLRNEYLRQLDYVCEALNVQCIKSGHGNPEISTDYMLDGWDISTQESSIIEILHEQGAKLFPPIVFSNVDRIPPELEPWKKALLEDLLSLQAIIVGKYNIDIGKYGIGCEMLLQILNSFDELEPESSTNKLRATHNSNLEDDMSRDMLLLEQEEKEQKAYLNHLFKEYSHLVKWLDIIPLFVQNRVPEPSDSEKIIIETGEVSGELVELREHVNFIKMLLNTIDECFPKFDEFERSEDKYNILIESISKFQQSDNIEQMYLQGISRGLNEGIGLPRTLAKSHQKHSETFDSDDLKELSRIIPRFMVLFWYAFEMDRDLVALFETYRGIFASDSNRNKDDHNSGTTTWTEFLHIVEDRKAMPSGFRHILSIVLGITSDDKPCIYFIDEPEISLHIEWQRKLVKHLKFLLDESRTNSMLLIATHSPDIMLNHLDDIVNFSLQLID